MEGTLLKLNNEWTIIYSDDDDQTKLVLPLLPSEVDSITTTGKVDFILHAEYVEELNPPYKVYARLFNPINKSK
jgi:hypothetical protein